MKNIIKFFSRRRRFKVILKYLGKFQENVDILGKQIKKMLIFKVILK